MKPNGESPRHSEAHYLQRDLLDRLQESLEVWTKGREKIASAFSSLNVGAILEKAGPDDRLRLSEPVILSRDLTAAREGSR